MTTNTYLHPQQGYSFEQDLYEGVIIENIQISGTDIQYIPRTISGDFSQIFGEDVLSSFDSYATIEMWLADFSVYGGESEMLSKFGMEVRDTATFIVSCKRYREEVEPIVPASRPEAAKFRPCEGDLIYVPFSHSLFEIRFVEDKFPAFYQLNKQYVWALRCELVQLNNDKFNTGLAEVDDTFGKLGNRLDASILAENGVYILTEDGGRLLDETYTVSEPNADNKGYGDNKAIKEEFLKIINFDVNNPFAENL